jgi:PAS domain S-box-containing protein
MAKALPVTPAAEDLRLHYQHLIETNTEDSIWSLDTDYRLVTFNRIFRERILQTYGVDVRLGDRIIDVAPALKKNWKRHYDRALRGETFSIIHHFTEHEPSLHMEVSFSPVRNAAGQVIGLAAYSRNVSQRVIAEVALQQSEEKFRRVAESVNALIFIAQDAKFIYVNEAVEQFTGYSFEELATLNLSTIIHPDDKATIRRQMQQLLDGVLAPGRYEFRFVHKDGDARWVDLDANLIEYQGQPALLGTALDITERKQAEEDLRRSEERYRDLVDNATDGIFTLDLQTNLTSVNPAFESMTGLTQASLLGQPLIPLLNPDDVPVAVQMFGMALQKQEPPAFELRLQPEDGECVTGEFKITPQTRNGDLVGVLGIVRDISRRKYVEAERDEYVKRLEILQDVDVELSQIINFDYVLKIALDAAVRMSRADAGAIHLTEGDGMRVAQVIGNYPRAMVGSSIPLSQGIIGRVMRTQKADWVKDVTQDADYMPNVRETCSQITVPLISQESLIGVLNVQTSEPSRFTQDTFNFIKLLSSRIASSLDNARLYQMLEKQLDELQDLYLQVSDLEQLKTQMIRIAAHDLRNPLGVIGGYLQMLGWEFESTNNTRGLGYLKTLNDAVSRMEKITQEILTLEKLNANVQGLMNELIDLHDIVSVEYEAYRTQASDKSIDYRLDSVATPVMVRGEPALLRETVSNLISNAIKYTPEKGRITIRLWETNGEANFEVEDTGYGVPEDQQEKLFQPFSRIVVKETKGIKGIGLGLHLVKSIIERHKGEMRFRSTYGEGSTFGFHLPLDEDAAAKAGD